MTRMSIHDVKQGFDSVVTRLQHGQSIAVTCGGLQQTFGILTTCHPKTNNREDRRVA
jgi:hypothetical protein